MPPVSEYSTWMMRSSDSYSKIEPKRKYVFICEGRNTEERYFRAVINPSFEPFLLLHQEGAYERTVRPHAKELLENRKVGSKRYVQTLFTSVFNMNPKKSLRVGTLAKDVDIAIAEERGLNQEVRDANLCLNHLTCNIGSTIKRICDDSLPLD
jgi:hypothetical protein